MQHPSYCVQSITFNISSHPLGTCHPLAPIVMLQKLHCLSDRLPSCYHGYEQLYEANARFGGGFCALLLLDVLST
jgi:hypothetical protein